MTTTTAGHEPTIWRFERGRSPVYGRPVYGTELRCQCGWKCKSNEPMSRGGRAEVNRQYRQHIKEATR